MVLYTGHLYSYIRDSSRLGISTILKHTLLDGSPDPNLSHLNYDIHLPILAPQKDLILGYYKKRYSWKDYVDIFSRYLQMDKVEETLVEVAKKSLEIDIFLLCVDPGPDRCHKRLLAQRAKMLIPDIEVYHIEPFRLIN